MAFNPAERNPNGTCKKGFTPNPGGKIGRWAFIQDLNAMFDDKNLTCMLMAILHGVDPSIKDIKNILKMISDLKSKQEFRKFIKNLGDLNSEDPKVNKKVWDKFSLKDRADMIFRIWKFKYGEAPQQMDMNLEGTITNRNLEISFIDTAKNHIKKKEE